MSNLTFTTVNLEDRIFKEEEYRAATEPDPVLCDVEESPILSTTLDKVELIQPTFLKRADDFFKERIPSFSKNTEQGAVDSQPKTQEEASDTDTILDQARPETFSEKATDFFKGIKEGAANGFTQIKRDVEQGVEEFTDASKGREANRKSEAYILTQNENLQTRIRAERAEISQDFHDRFEVKREYQAFVPGNGTFSSVTNFYREFHKGVEDKADSYGQAAGKTAHGVADSALRNTIGKLGIYMTNTKENRAQRFQERTALNVAIATEFTVKSIVRLGHLIPVIPTLVVGGVLASAVAVVAATSPIWGLAYLIYSSVKNLVGFINDLRSLSERVTILETESKNDKQEITVLTTRVTQLEQENKNILARNAEDIKNSLDLFHEPLELTKTNNDQPINNSKVFFSEKVGLFGDSDSDFEDLFHAVDKPSNKTPAPVLEQPKAEVKQPVEQPVVEQPVEQPIVVVEQPVEQPVVEQPVEQPIVVVDQPVVEQPVEQPVIEKIDEEIDAADVIENSKITELREQLSSELPIDVELSDADDDEYFLVVPK